MPSLVTESKRWWRSEPLEASHQHSKTHHRFSAQTPSLRSPCSSRFYALVSSSVISSKRTAGPTNLLLPFFWCAVELEDYCFSSFMDNLFDKKSELFVFVSNRYDIWQYVIGHRVCVPEGWCYWWASSGARIYWFSVRICSSFICFPQSFSTLGNTLFLSISSMKFDVKL